MTLKTKWFVAYIVEHALFLGSIGLAWSVDWRLGVAVVAYEVQRGLEQLRAHFGRQAIALEKAKALKKKEESN